MIPTGRPFFKMSGSGNDFVMVDARQDPPGRLADAKEIQEICARGSGVGADGIVFLEPPESPDAAVRLIYLNADGSRADFCGNATLCTTRLAVELGAASPKGLAIETDDGIVAARIEGDKPEIDLPPVSKIDPQVPAIPLESGEQKMGFAKVGVPHIVIRVDDVSTVDVVGRGRPLRHHSSLPDGANVNFVSRDRYGRWRIRTYERGVEAETLACGSGAVATAIMLTVWGEASGDVFLETKSGRELRVRSRQEFGQGAETPNGKLWYPSLSGEARVVFEGRLSEI